MNQCRGWWQGSGGFQGSEVLQINRQTSQLSCLSRGRVCWQERGKRRRHGSRVASDRPQIKAILFESVEMNQKQFHEIPVIHRDSISHLPTFQTRSLFIPPFVPRFHHQFRSKCRKSLFFKILFIRLEEENEKSC